MENKLYINKQKARALATVQTLKGFFLLVKHKWRVKSVIPKPWAADGP